MDRWTAESDVARGTRPVVAIGVYDGVHRGHRLLVRRAMADARAAGVPSVVLTFTPNPAEVVRPDAAPTRLSTLDHRLRLLGSLGVDATWVLAFDEDLARMSPEQFVKDVLLGVLGASEVVVGENFRFGRRAAGDVAALAEFGGPGGMTVDAVPLLRQELLGRADVPISSSEIRGLVADGNVEAAARGLARPHRVEGTVVAGAARGRDLGYPTANVAATELAAIPGDGVYAGRLLVDPYGAGRQVLPAAISVGNNPTFGGTERTLEAYALDAPADFDLYDAYVAVDFVSRLRRQMTFTSATKLQQQIAADEVEARARLGLG